MTIRKKDLEAIGQTVRELRAAIEAIAPVPTDSASARGIGQAFDSASRDLCRIIGPHATKGFSPERFLSACGAKGVR
jgi:hypothetical protein